MSRRDFRSVAGAAALFGAIILGPTPAMAAGAEPVHAEPVRVEPTHAEEEGLHAAVARDGDMLSVCLDVVAGRHLNGSLGITVTSPEPRRFRTRLPIELSTGDDYFKSPMLIPIALLDQRRKLPKLSIEAGVCGEEACDPVTLVVDPPTADTAPCGSGR